MPREQDWADVEDHDFLNGYVGKRVQAITTGTNAEGSDWLRLVFPGVILEVRAVGLTETAANLEIEEP